MSFDASFTPLDPTASTFGQKLSTIFYETTTALPGGVISAGKGIASVVSCCADQVFEAMKFCYGKVEGAAISSAGSVKQTVVETYQKVDRQATEALIGKVSTQDSAARKAFSATELLAPGAVVVVSGGLAVRLWWDVAKKTYMLVTFSTFEPIREETTRFRNHEFKIKEAKRHDRHAIVLEIATSAILATLCSCVSVLTAMGMQERIDSIKDSKPDATYPGYWACFAAGSILPGAASVQDCP